VARDGVRRSKEGGGGGGLGGFQFYGGFEAVGGQVHSRGKKDVRLA